jgi:hypothetical protein
VRREELYSLSSAGSTPDPELEQLFRDRVQLEFQPDTGAESLGEITYKVPEIVQEEEVEFRLFAASSKTRSSGNATRIRIRSLSVDDRPPGLVKPERAKSYYFRDSLSPAAEEQIRIAAVSGEDILARSKTPNPGCSLPWRVTTIQAASTISAQTATILLDQNDPARKKKRKGKKTRIAIRQNVAETSHNLEKEKRAAAEKELADRMKKAKRNREKKIKKRVRDKLKAQLANGEKVMNDVTAESEDTSNEE